LRTLETVATDTPTAVAISFTVTIFCTNLAPQDVRRTQNGQVRAVRVAGRVRVTSNCAARRRTRWCNVLSAVVKRFTNQMQSGSPMLPSGEIPAKLGMNEVFTS
jgi:hypothetical protein